ncbi:pyridoxamine 5'-phosphate oxidase [Celeribacter halophilus]|jgi:pyridoxamine 5'-phosphate oxidase|uniref:Pyridoxine/pyridoxamine 5'-phosphate oxidase n=1 Tax=Celeribacter halophilus TaxID=576117 RepID=A0AAW7XSB5_9RHOB|nr:pyridoxamine 5'-phosphate oxidase [Celeribacter halophilus]MBU2888735.1 pyridoxamine 5'-phosphate oxidase [Celeribacter halophilus]MDO6455889.1 pyridoxamine 5'-phosphate oxidase [Celeribacter halophilus]MDO6508911.1 pyridoxamine 5'-phosphate oxidase [Celeribacter halophilus]MDO6722077.1 pyridoxamine 5'-phosphate oxidase [Celeribacter halophilus]
MVPRKGIFKGDDPFEISRRWLKEAEAKEINDPNAIAIATVDGDGLPNVRMVLLKEIADDAFVFFTNYESAKGQEIEKSGKAAFVMHWKSLRRQVRVRGLVTRETAEASDAYYKSRALGSRIGAWASKQSRPLESKAALMEAVAKEGMKHGPNPKRPPFWGGYRITPLEIEFWADGEFRLHDRFRWSRATPQDAWEIVRLNP